MGVQEGGPYKVFAREGNKNGDVGEKQDWQFYPNAKGPGSLHQDVPQGEGGEGLVRERVASKEASDAGPSRLGLFFVHGSQTLFFDKQQSNQEYNPPNFSSQMLDSLIDAPDMAPDDCRIICHALAVTLCKYIQAPICLF